MGIEQDPELPSSAQLKFNSQDLCCTAAQVIAETTAVNNVMPIAEYLSAMRTRGVGAKIALNALRTMGGIWHDATSFDVSGIDLAKWPPGNDNKRPERYRRKILANDRYRIFRGTLRKKQE